MKNLTLLLCALSVACCADRRQVENAAAAASTRSAALSADAAIFPAELGEQVRWLGYTGAVAFWTPTSADVAPLEDGLGALLEHGASNPAELDDYARDRPEYQSYLRGELDLILERLGDYRRQYVGVIDADGRRRILVRAFAGPRFGDGFEFERWREELAIVSDGGFWYWFAVYDPETQRLVYLRSNGYA